MQKNYNNKTFSAKMVPTKLNSYHKNLYFDIKTYYGTKNYTPHLYSPNPLHTINQSKDGNLNLKKNHTGSAERINIRLRETFPNRDV